MCVISMCMHMCVPSCVYLCMYVCISVCACVYLHVCACGVVSDPSVLSVEPPNNMSCNYHVYSQWQS